MPHTEQHPDPSADAGLDTIEWAEGETKILHTGEEGQWIQILDRTIEVNLEDLR